MRTFKAHFWKMTTAAILLALAACSTAQTRVMPGASGLHTAVSSDIERDDANVAAIDAANDYCKERGLHAVFESQASEYRGSMDEDARNTIRSASKAASMIGGFDSPISQAGQAGVHATNERDYDSQVKFRCVN